MQLLSSRAGSLVAGGALLALVVTACSDDESSSESTVAVTAAPSPFEGELIGTFAIDATLCTDGVFLGSYLQMVVPGGTVDAGPVVANDDSPCDDPNFTALVPGSDGGLVTGAFQPAPDPAYDADGNGLAAAVVEPIVVSGKAIGIGTDPASATPSITSTVGVLDADLSAFTGYAGGVGFAQGAPRPDGTGEGPEGQIRLDTGRYVLDWSSPVVGGPFDGYTAVWHLVGTFTPR